MKNKKILFLIISTLVLSMTGCGDGMTPEEREAANRQETGISISELLGRPIDSGDELNGQEDGQEQTDSELEQQIRELEQRCGTPDFTREEYLTLAELYGGNRQVRKQRDTLEICFSLFQDSSAAEQLQQLTVNAAEEEAGIQEQLSRLDQELSIAEYVNEAVSMLHGEEWRETMMPRLSQGTRGYYREQGDVLLYVRTGYDEGGAPYTQIQRLQGDQLTVLLQTGESVQLLETSVKNGSYDGVYESWTVLASSGDVIRENGNFRDGVLVGDYTAQIRWGGSADDLLSLWNMREDMEMTTYNGNFGEDGISTMDQPESGQLHVTQGGSQAGDVIVYAYDSAKQNYLFLSREETETAESYVFRAEAMGMPVLETYAVYVPREDQGSTAPAGTIDLARLQVRVFDGNIEVFDGRSWINMGAAETYMAADPMADSQNAGNQAAGSESGGNTDGGEVRSSKIAARYANRGGGQVAPAATPKPTSKPAAPAAPVTPVAPTVPVAPIVVPTPEPAAPSNPEPAQPSNPEPVQPSNPAPAQPSNPAPAPQPTPEPAPEPTPEPAPTDPPITGGDSDVEWSPDLM